MVTAVMIKRVRPLIELVNLHVHGQRPMLSTFGETQSSASAAASLFILLDEYIGCSMLNIGFSILNEVLADDGGVAAVVGVVGVGSSSFADAALISTGAADVFDIFTTTEVLGRSFFLGLGVLEDI